MTEYSSILLTYRNCKKVLLVDPNSNNKLYGNGQLSIEDFEKLKKIGKDITPKNIMGVIQTKGSCTYVLVRNNTAGYQVLKLAVLTDPILNFMQNKNNINVKLPLLSFYINRDDFLQYFRYNQKKCYFIEEYEDLLNSTAYYLMERHRDIIIEKLKEQLTDEEWAILELRNNLEE